MKSTDRFTPPLFRLYQASTNKDFTPDDLKAAETRGKWIQLFYDVLTAFIYSLALTALSLTLSDLSMNWPRQLLVQAGVFLLINLIRPIAKWVMAGLSILVIIGFIYVYFADKSETLWRTYLLPAYEYFYNIGSFLSGYEVENATPGTYALLLGAGIAFLSVIFGQLSFHPWIMLISAGAVFGVAMKDPTLYQLVFFLIAIFAVFMRLSKKRDFATVQQRAVVRRASIASNRYVKTAVPIVLVLMAFILLFNTLLPEDVFYSKTLDDMVSRLTGYSFNEDKSIGYYEFSLRNSGYYPLDTRLGGPVSPSNEPYIEVTSGQHSMYLRGAVYSTYTGQLWRQDTMDPNWMFNHQRNRDVQRDILGMPLNATVTEESKVLEPSPRMPMTIVPLKEQQVVFSAGRVDNLTYAGLNEEMYAYFNIAGTMYSDQVIPDSGYIADGEQFRLDLIQRGDVLTALSQGFAGNEVPRINRDGDASRWLQLPAIQNLQATVAAHDQTLHDLVYAQPNLSQTARVLAIRERIAETFSYNLEVPAPEANREFVTWFFETKEGYCTYFATTYAVLLREAGIPARYVEGFLVPAMPGGGSRIVSGEQAHAWTEVWFPGMGWIPFDATPQGTLDEMTQEDEIPEEPEPDFEEPEPEPTPEPTPEPEQPDPPPTEEDEPQRSFWQTLLLVLWTILKWLLFLSPLIAYLVWRYIVWKRRHDIPYLVKRFKGDEDKLVIAVWEDLRSIWELRGIKAMEDETVRQFFQRLLRSKKLDLDPSLTTYEAVEKALYSEHPFDNRELVDLLVLYRREEMSAKEELPLHTWLFKRYLWSPKHPL